MQLYVLVFTLKQLSHKDIERWSARQLLAWRSSCICGGSRLDPTSIHTKPLALSLYKRASDLWFLDGAHKHDTSDLQCGMFTACIEHT